MKKVVLSAFLLAFGTLAMAQQNQRMQKMDPAKMEERRAEHLKKMKTELNLSDAQVMKIKTLQDQRIAERNQNALQKEAERKVKMETMKAKQEQHNAEMKKILTAEQYQKWQAGKEQKMKENRKMMKRNHMGSM